MIPQNTAARDGREHQQIDPGIAENRVTLSIFQYLPGIIQICEKLLEHIGPHLLQLDPLLIGRRLGRNLCWRQKQQEKQRCDG